MPHAPTAPPPDPEVLSPSGALPRGTAGIAAGANDPVIGCLTALARHHHRVVSEDALVSGLPLDQGRLPASAVARAAERAGLAARVVRRPLKGIDDIFLPCILLLEGGDACVLTARRGDGQCDILLPAAGAGVATLPVEELAGRYAGYAILARPLHRPSATLPNDAGGSWFWGTLAHFWRDYLHLLAAAVLINALAVVTPLLALTLFDRLLPQADLPGLRMLTIGAGLALLFDATLRGLRGTVAACAARNAEVLLHGRLVQQLLSRPVAGRPGSAGGFAGLVQAFDESRQGFGAFLTAAVDLPFTAVLLAVMAWVGGPLALAPLLALGLAVPVVVALCLPLRPLARRSLAHGQARQGLLVECVAGFEAVKALGAESRMAALLETEVGTVARLALSMRLLAGAVRLTPRLLAGAATLAVLAWGGLLVADRTVTVGGLIACALLVGPIFQPITRLAEAWSDSRQGAAVRQELRAALDPPAERVAAVAPALRRQDLSGEVEFRDVVFRYPGQTRPALAGVSFRIAAGEHVALAGPAGAGKTTVARLLLGLYPPSEGEVLVDGTAVEHIDPADLRRCFGLSPQEPTLFAGSIRDNIALAAPWIEDEAILRAAAIAGLDQMLRSAPAGLATLLGERGDGLSAGQRRAVALARAVVADPTVLVLDDPAAGLDPQAEDRLRRRLSALLPGRGLVLITHSPGLLSLTQRVIRLDAGHVFADGPAGKSSLLSASAMETRS